MAWSMRRELWENRSIVIAPFAVAALVIFSVMLPVIKLLLNSEDIGIGTEVRGALPDKGLWVPYLIAAAPALGVGLFVAAVYCLGALHGERRDRSILFWKSLPVSDRTTILSKASIPLLIVPLVSLAAAVLTQLVIFAVVLLGFPLVAGHLVWNGMPVDYHTVAHIWAGVPAGNITLSMLYGVLAAALWHAPIYAWLLLVGGWAQRLAVLWAVAPVGGLILVERIGLGTDHLAALLEDRLFGFVPLAFSEMNGNALPYMTPLHFLSAPGLWAGFAATALFLGAATWLRRYKQPI
jgi:ABC-2 type transport system permease protein